MHIKDNYDKYGMDPVKNYKEGPAKTTATEAPADPILLLLQLRPRNNYSECGRNAINYTSQENVVSSRLENAITRLHPRSPYMRQTQHHRLCQY